MTRFLAVCRRRRQVNLDTTFAENRCSLAPFPRRKQPALAPAASRLPHAYHTGATRDSACTCHCLNSGELRLKCLCSMPPTPKQHEAPERSYARRIEARRTRCSSAGRYREGRRRDRAVILIHSSAGKCCALWRGAPDEPASARNRSRTSYLRIDTGFSPHRHPAANDASLLSNECVRRRSWGL